MTIVQLIHYNHINMPLCACTGPMLPVSDQYRPGTGTYRHVYGVGHEYKHRYEVSSFNAYSIPLLNKFLHAECYCLLYLISTCIYIESMIIKSYELHINTKLL